MHVFAVICINIDPMCVVDAPRSRAKVQKQRRWTGSNIAPDTSVLKSDRVSDPKSKKVQVPAYYCKGAMAQEKKQDLTQSRHHSEEVAVAVHSSDLTY